MTANARPPDPKRSPGAEGTARGADRREVGDPKNKLQARRAQEPARELSIYAGREHIGDVIQRGQRVNEATRNGRSVGVFRSFAEAARAISAAAKGGVE